jgi:chorismate mutase
MAYNMYQFSNRIPGGVYGTNQSMTSTGIDIFQRMLSPEEWQELPGGQRMEFQGYMDYVNKFQKQQRQRQRMDSRTPQGGMLQFAGGGSPSATIRVGGASGGAGGIPKYKTVTDIRGNTTFQPVGGKRDIGGEYIPTSLEDVQDAEQLKYAVPKMQATAEADLYNELNRVAQLKASERNPKALMEQQKIGQRNVSLAQGQQRNDLSAQKEANVMKRFYQSQDYKTANMNLMSDLRIKAIGVVAKLKDASNVLDNDQQMMVKNAMGLLVGTANYDEKQQDAINKAKEILAMRYEQERDNDKRARIEDIQDELILAERMATMKNIGELKFEKDREAMARGELNKFGEQVQRITGAGAQPTTAPKVGDVIDGYKYLGGDPSKPTSWKKL